MKARVFALCVAAALCALPLLAASPPDIPAGDDVWDTPGGGGTNVVLSSADWFALCSITVPDTAVQFKGFNIPGQGTGDTLVTRQNIAVLPSIGSSATIPIKLKDLSFVSDGSHLCSPLTLRAREATGQATGSMTITRTSSGGGTFSASVPVTAIVEAVNGSGTVVGSTVVNGVLNDTSASPWSYSPPSGGAPQPAPWYPGVNPATGAKVRTCRIGNKTLPAQHCYQPPPKCGGTTGTGGGGTGGGGSDDTEPIGGNSGTGDYEIGDTEVVDVNQAEPCYLTATPHQTGT